MPYYTEGANDKYQPALKSFRIGVYHIGVGCFIVRGLHCAKHNTLVPSSIYNTYAKILQSLFGLPGCNGSEIDDSCNFFLDLEI